MPTVCLTRNTIITTTTEPDARLRLWRRFVRPHQGLLLLALPLMVVVAAATSAYPLLISFAFKLLEAGDPRILTLIPLGFIGFALTKALALYGQILLTNALALRTVRDLQSAMFAHVQDMDIAQLNQDASGLLVSRFTNDVNLAKEALVRVSNNLVRDALSVVGLLGAMLWMNWKLALIILLVYPLATFPVIWLGRRVRALSDAAQHQIGRMTALLSESIAGTQMVRSFGLESREQSRAKTSFAERYQLAMQLTRTKAAVDPFLEVLGAAALAAVIAYAGWRAMSGNSAIPELMGFIAALAAMAPAARAIGTLNAVWQEGMAAITRAFTLLDEIPTITSRPDAKPLVINSGEVRLEAINFAYGEDSPALSNFSITAKPGQTLALVGPSGAGKSSIFNLLLRFYDPQSGQVLLDGTDISTCDLASLRHAISVVSQHPVLFDDTVRANIVFGRSEANDQQIRAAAQGAAALTFIESLPHGFETRVGENGNALSGGQRQRIAIARAILKDAPILLLDEATSALDGATEAKVQDALAKLMQNRTTLVIAHRLATVRNADLIVVLDHGQVVEQGKHDSLLAQGGLYTKLAGAQLR